MGLVIDYIIALTHLYELVHKDKVADIYNMQNDGNVGAADVADEAKHHVDVLRKNYVELYGDYFVHEAIMEFDEFEQELAKRQGKPFYIPDQQELLKYKDDLYFERTKEYKALEKYVQQNFFPGNAHRTEMLCEDVYDECQLGPSLDDVFLPFERQGITFESKNQVKEVMDLIMNLSNNIRLPENNGFTPHELHTQFEQPMLNPLPDESFESGTNQTTSTATDQGGKKVEGKKIGRNDPCPCGSGKKYKKCCGA